MWQRLSNLIPSALKKSGISQQVSDSLVCQEFDKISIHILGSNSKSCRALYLKNRQLTVAVLSKSIANELKFYEEDILKALTDKFGAGKVEKLWYLD